jgi:hypothetical protein
MNDLLVPEKKLGVCNLHLVSGEDIVGQTFEKRDVETGMLSYVVLHPVTPNIQMGSTSDGRPAMRLGLLPLRPYIQDNPKEMEVPAVYVMYVVPAGEKLERTYIELTSDITIATAVPDNLKGLVVK